MSLGDFYTISQILASAAVLASLVYLALQTRQAALHQKSTLHQNRAAQISHDFAARADADIAAVLAAGDAGDEPLTEVHFRQYFAVWYTTFLQMEEQYLQRREGNFERWRLTERGLGVLMSQPGARAIARMFQRIADKEFAAVLEQAMVEARARPSADLKSAWFAMATEERSSQAAA
jgi:hypothetical protein